MKSIRDKTFKFERGYCKMSEVKGFGSLECKREQDLALELFKLLRDGKLTELAERNFDKSSCDVYFNSNSGNVFLSDEDYNTVMEINGELDLFINTPYGGREGFFNEIMEEWEDLHIEDKEHLEIIATEELKEKYADQFKEIIVEKITQ